MEPADPAVVDEVARLSNEGVRLSQTNKSGEAEDLLRRALALAEEKLGADHASSAVCLNNLGEFLSQKRRFEEAEPILRRAVAAKETLHGPEALETGTALSNLALVLRRMERFAEAETLYRRLLPIFEQGHGPESIEVASLLNNLAQVPFERMVLHRPRRIARRTAVCRVKSGNHFVQSPAHDRMEIFAEQFVRQKRSPDISYAMSDYKQSALIQTKWRSNEPGTRGSRRWLLLGHAGLASPLSRRDLNPGRLFGR